MAESFINGMIIHSGGAEEEEGLIGDVPPFQKYQPPMDVGMLAEEDRLTKEIMDFLGNEGVVSPVTQQDERRAFDESVDSAGLDERLDTLLRMEQDNGGQLDFIGRGQGASNARQLDSFTQSVEGFSPIQYDDLTGGNRRWKPGSDGNPTIGYGTNLHAPGVRKQIEDLGYKFEDIMSGKKAISEPHARRLSETANRGAYNFIRTKFKDQNLPIHQVNALASMVTNSRWHKDKGPTLIGPRLTAAIREGRMMDAAKEIAWFSENVRAEWRKGIHSRRVKEAKMFLGPELARRFEVLFGWDVPDDAKKQRAPSDAELKQMIGEKRTRVRKRMQDKEAAVAQRLRDKRARVKERLKRK